MANELGFVTDIPSWCRRTGNSLMALSNSDGVYTALVKKAELLENPEMKKKRTVKRWWSFPTISIK